MMRAGVALVAIQAAVVVGVITYADSLAPAHGAPVVESFSSGELFSSRVAPATGRTIPACATDEGPDGQGIRPCVWDARHMGNGEGRSFVIRRTGRLQYLSHHNAHRLTSHN